MILGVPVTVLIGGIFETTIGRIKGKIFSKVSGHDKATENILEFQILPPGGAFSAVSNKI